MSEKPPAAWKTFLSPYSGDLRQRPIAAPESNLTQTQRPLGWSKEDLAFLWGKEEKQRETASAPNSSSQEAEVNWLRLLRPGRGLRRDRQWVEESRPLVLD